MTGIHWILIGAVGAGPSLVFAWREQLGRLRLLEYKLDILQRQAGIEPLQALHQACLPLMQANRSLEAIRLFRQRTGADQRTTRHQIDAWMVEVAVAMAAGPEPARY